MQTKNKRALPLRQSWWHGGREKEYSSLYPGSPGAVWTPSFGRARGILHIPYCRPAIAAKLEGPVQLMNT